MRYSQTVFKTKANAKKFARLYSLLQIFHASCIDSEGKREQDNENIITGLRAEWAEKEILKMGYADALVYGSFDSLLEWYLETTNTEKNEL